MSGEFSTSHVRVFAIAVLLVFVGWVISLVRHHRLSLRDSLLWLISTLAALAVAIYPQFLIWTGRALQIELPSNALFTLSFLYVLVNLLSVTLAVSSSSARVRRLTQECALLRAELQILREKDEHAPPPSGGGR